ncbi:MAG: hypothetical protein OXE96_16230 [Gemmatimonadetes bacterium]|nr:hypothetical protein [Gemmatimonadota bacterium]
MSRGRRAGRSLSNSTGGRESSVVPEDTSEAGTRPEGVVSAVPAASASTKAENVLEGVSCPQCGKADEFRVVAEVTVHVTDDGPYTDDGDEYTWGADSWALCPGCEFEADWQTFQTGSSKWTAAKEAA